MSDAQIVVAGAGHNSLITAAYLAVAGYSVLVLDARAIPGFRDDWTVVQPVVPEHAS